MAKKEQVPMRRITLEIPEDLIRRLKRRASLEGVAPRDLVAAWIQSWPRDDRKRRAGEI